MQKFKNEIEQFREIKEGIICDYCRKLFNGKL